MDEALHGLPVAYAIMRNETDPNLEFSYLEFKKILGETSIKYFFVDKAYRVIVKNFGISI